MTQISLVMGRCPLESRLGQCLQWQIILQKISSLHGLNKTKLLSTVPPCEFHLEPYAPGLQPCWLPSSYTLIKPLPRATQALFHSVHPSALCSQSLPPTNSSRPSEFHQNSQFNRAAPSLAIVWPPSLLQMYFSFVRVFD